MTRRVRRRTEGGAAAVEAALVLGTMGIPLLLGVITYGHYFWQAQRVQEHGPRLHQGAVVGVFATCNDLAQAVRSATVAAADDLNGTLPTPVTGDMVTVIISLLPSVGADVDVSIEVPLAEQLGGFVPLPNGGATTIDLSQRLMDVTVSSGELVCQLSPAAMP